MLDYEALDDPDALVFIPHHGGISRPPEAVPHRHTRNALSSQIRCKMTGIDISKFRPAMATQGIPKSPVRRWLVDTGSAYDLVKRKDVEGLRSLCRDADVDIMFYTAGGKAEGTKVVPMHIETLDEVVEPYILASTPNVLTVGM